MWVCFSCSEQVGTSWTNYFNNLGLFYRNNNFTSVLDAIISYSNEHNIQLVWFIIGIWANDFQKIQLIPSFILTPLTFLGGSFYSIGMLPDFWQKLSYVNPIVYLISSFRWSFYGNSDVNVVVSISATLFFLFLCIVFVSWIFKTGYKIKT